MLVLTRITNTHIYLFFLYEVTVFLVELLSEAETLFLQGVKPVPPLISSHRSVRKEFYVGAWKGVTEERNCPSTAKLWVSALKLTVGHKGSD